MKKVLFYVLFLFVIVISFASGFYVSTKNVFSGMEGLVLDCFYDISDIVDEAYYDGDRETAVWAINSFIKILDKKQDEIYENKWLNSDDLSFVLMIQHARLGKLYHDTDSKRSMHHMSLSKLNMAKITNQSWTDDQIQDFLINRGKL